MIFGAAHRFNYLNLYTGQRKSWKGQLLALPFSLLAISLALACKSETGLFVSGDAIPTFEVRRDRFDEVKVFPILTVVQLDRDNERLSPLREDERKNKVLWKVVADPSAVDKTPIENLDKIEYGEVPKGFIQEVPKVGEPQLLVEGQTYEATGPLSLMRNAAVRFRITGGKVVIVKIPE